MKNNHSELTLLRCGNCGSDLEGLPTDVIFYCQECGKCWILEEKLSPVKIEFLRTGGPETVFLPFWKVDASVSILNRITRMESSMSPLEGSRELSGMER